MNPSGNKIKKKHYLLNCVSETDHVLFRPTPRPFVSKFHVVTTLKVPENIMGTSE